MTKQTKAKVKHVPQRTCVGCHLVLPKRSLIRLVKTPAGVIVDPSGKAAGRGAYLHNQRSCWERGLKGPLAHALKTDLTNDEIESLKAFMATLPENIREEDMKGLSTQGSIQ